MAEERSNRPAAPWTPGSAAPRPPGEQSVEMAVGQKARAPWEQATGGSAPVRVPAPGIRPSDRLAPPEAARTLGEGALAPRSSGELRRESVPTQHPGAAAEPVVRDSFFSLASTQARSSGDAARPALVEPLSGEDDSFDPAIGWTFDSLDSVAKEGAAPDGFWERVPGGTSKAPPAPPPLLIDDDPLANLPLGTAIESGRAPSAVSVPALPAVPVPAPAAQQTGGWLMGPGATGNVAVPPPVSVVAASSPALHPAGSAAASLSGRPAVSPSLPAAASSPALAPVRSAPPQPVRPPTGSSGDALAASMAGPPPAAAGLGSSLPPLPPLPSPESMRAAPPAAAAAPPAPRPASATSSVPAPSLGVRPAPSAAPTDLEGGLQEVRTLLGEGRGDEAMQRLDRLERAFPGDPRFATWREFAERKIAQNLCPAARPDRIPVLTRARGQIPAVPGTPAGRIVDAIDGRSTVGRIRAGVGDLPAQGFYRTLAQLITHGAMGWADEAP